MLIIEVDGITHQWEEIAENDKIREEALVAIEFTVMRFDDDDVLTAINGVYYQIEDFTPASLPCTHKSFKSSTHSGLIRRHYIPQASPAVIIVQALQA